MRNLTSPQNQKTLFIGCGAGFSGDRWDAAVPVVKSLRKKQGPSVLMFETLAERTLALAQLKRQQDPNSGWEPALERFITPILRDCIEGNIPIVGNFGAANPAGAGKLLQKLAASMGFPSIKIAVIEGDDLQTQLSADELQELLPQALKGKSLVSANAYMGAEAIAQALRKGAQMVISGRVADPALALGPMIAHFGWSMNAWNLLAAGTMAGHLLECGAQVCGGYYADPGIKDVPDLANVGFPIVEMSADGGFIVTKAEETGGYVTRSTVIEQLLYEIHDPAAYLTPDVIADITNVEIDEEGPNRVRVSKVCGHPHPPTLKATICYEGGWLAEGEISYAGFNAQARARLATEVVCERLKIIGLGHLKVRADLIGISSVFPDDSGNWWGDHTLPLCEDVRVRIASTSELKEDAEAVAREVLALYTCGPAAGGGVRTRLTPRMISDSCYVPRDWMKSKWSFV